MKSFIQHRLTKRELNELVQYVSYHLNWVPKNPVYAIFTKTADEFATWYQTCYMEPEEVADLSKNTTAFYDQSNYTIVFRGFSYVKGVEIDQFIFTMATVIHEIMHHFQYTSGGGYGSYNTLIEGTADLLTMFLLGESTEMIDYKIEALLTYNMAMEICGHNFWETIRWIKRYMVHSSKNRFVHKELKNCAAFAKYKPQKLMKLVEDNSPELPEQFRKYKFSDMTRLLEKYRSLI